MVLETKNKEKFINDSLLRPLITDPLHDDWRKCNHMVMCWLTRSMSPSIKQLVMWVDTNIEIRKDLKEHFSHANKFRIVDLQDLIKAANRRSSKITLRREDA